MPQIQVFTHLKKKTPSPSFTQMVPKHRLDHQPEICIFQVTGLDIEAWLHSLLKPIFSY